MPAALVIRDLYKKFQVGFIPKKVQALNGVSMEVEAGEIFGLLGPNGAGKTTTIKCILNLIHPDSGTIELLGDRISSSKAKSRIGFLSENPYVYEFLTGREYLIFAAKLHGYDTSVCRKKADELLNFFHLTDAAGRPLRKYSKGMLQRLGLAQALVNDPEFLIMDEPMSGLDPLGRKEVRDLLLSLRDRGKTLLFSSHILADAEMICDRVAILINGKVVTIGKLQELMKKIEGYEVTLRNARQTVLEHVPHQLITHTDSTFLVQVPSVAEVEAILSLSRTHEFEIESIVPQRQTLEELYLKQIK
jgi:ABC-2 type transport system ATP-binding protein